MNHKSNHCEIEVSDKAKQGIVFKLKLEFCYHFVTAFKLSNGGNTLISTGNENLFLETDNLSFEKYDLKV